MKNILFFGVLLEIGFLRRGPSFVGMTILGGCFGMRWLVLTQRSLLCWDDNFGWVVVFGMGIGYLRRGPSFVGMTRFGWVEGLLI